MLVEVGCIRDAEELFGCLCCRNEMSWNSLMYGYTKCGKPQHALDLYQRMRIERSISPSAYSIVAALKACTHLKNLRVGADLHSEASKWGLLPANQFVCNALIDMYAKCGALSKAQGIFDKLSAPNVVSWTLLISGYGEHGYGNKALGCLNRMQCEGIIPDAVALIVSLKACINVGKLKNVAILHSAIDRQHLLDQNLIVGNTLIDVYIKCGLLAEAQHVFDTLPIRDVVAWTTMIAGYVDHGYCERAVQHFDEMQIEGVSPDVATLNNTLKACGSIGASNKGRELHAMVERQGFLARSHAACNTLVDMYSKCGLVAKARQVFDMLSYRDVVSWTALISGYAECGYSEQAIDCFEKMKADGFLPNAVTFICCLKGCSTIGAIRKGKDIHVEIERRGLLREDPIIATSLVDMYAKCGFVSRAQEVFERLADRDGVCWTALMMGYAQSGQILNLFNMFDRMVGEGIKPNLVTMIVVLGACNQTSFSSKAERYFEAMSQKYGIAPVLEHYTCVLNFLIHAGEPDRANAVIENMPFRPDFVMRQALLNAWKSTGGLEVGMKVVGHVIC